MDEKRPISRVILFVGDAIVILLITIAGFISHGEGSAVLRMLTTFLPLCVGWGFAATVLGLYETQLATDLRQAWRSIFAALLGVPLAAWLRGIWLNSPILPIFVGVLFAVTAVSLTFWRSIWALIIKGRVLHG